MAYEDSYIPMNMWSKDHWTTLAYIGFQVGRDARMRSNRRNFRATPASQCSRIDTTRPIYSTLGLGTADGRLSC